MKEAIAAVRKGEMAVLRASKVFGVPRSTLQCKVKSKETNLEKLVDPRRGPRPYLSEDLEEELVQFACDNDGATATEIKKMAFQLSEKMGLHHPFNRDDGTAGRKWFQSFKKRHPEVAVRRKRRPFT
uniref:Ligand-dependent nuclear receptor corepressor-like protein n=1 Tax=Lygus hesperus TaxID=30085 RepID=A0A0A9XD57_LYGHE